MKAVADTTHILATKSKKSPTELSARILRELFDTKLKAFLAPVQYESPYIAVKQIITSINFSHFQRLTDFYESVFIDINNEFLKNPETAPAAPEAPVTRFLISVKP